MAKRELETEPSIAPPRFPPRYLVRRLLGEGGFGRVFEAWDETLSRKCAIKVARSSEQNERLLREARAVAALNSQHIVSIYDVGHLSDGAPYLVMEYLNGRSLAEVLAGGSKVSIEAALSWTHQICLALNEAHQAGVTHRDIKPSNLHLLKDAQGLEVLKLLDFGIARSQSTDEPDLTASGLLIGSPSYMSPEQIRNQPVDARTDLWSTGVVLYRMLSGRLPFPHSDRLAVLASIVADPPVPLENLVSGISQELLQIVERCLAKSTKDRFSTAGELDDALRLVARTRSIDWPTLSSRRELGLIETPSTLETQTTRYQLEAAKDQDVLRKNWHLKHLVVLLLASFGTAGAWVLVRDDHAHPVGISSGLEEPKPQGQPTAAISHNPNGQDSPDIAEKSAAVTAEEGKSSRAEVPKKRTDRPPVSPPARPSAPKPPSTESSRTTPANAQDGTPTTNAPPVPPPKTPPGPRLIVVPDF